MKEDLEPDEFVAPVAKCTTKLGIKKPERGGCSFVRICQVCGSICLKFRQGASFVAYVSAQHKSHPRKRNILALSCVLNCRAGLFMQHLR